MLHDKRRRILTVLAVSLLVCGLCSWAQAVTFFRSSADFYSPSATAESVFADIVNEPNSGIWWDQATITYQLDDAVKSVWPSTLHQDLIKQAFTLWGEGPGRDYGTTNSHLVHYPQWGSQIFDIATLALHELGHGLGYGHPFQGAEADLNFQYPDWDLPTPYDGTQVWEPGDDTDGEVMGYGADFGSFNRQLSWDELNGVRYHYLYGGGSANGLNFVEITDGSPTDIVVTAEALGWSDLGGVLALKQANSEGPDGGIGADFFGAVNLRQPRAA